MKIGENSKGQQLDLNNRLAQYLPVFLNSQANPSQAESYVEPFLSLVSGKGTGCSETF